VLPGEPVTAARPDRHQGNGRVRPTARRGGHRTGSAPRRGCPLIGRKVAAPR
jgi:hypothetical protein